ncbi:MAG: DUF1553 domain-containing protein [Luteolibacter sp.]
MKNYLLRCMILISGAVPVVDMAGAATQELVVPYEAGAFAVARSKIDDLVFGALHKAGLKEARPCSDEVFVRRVFLDVLGVIPEAGEVRAFLQDAHPGKRAVLIDALLARDEYVDYWSMKWCDLLRVKSEFPINLWPNAVQAYQRWVREALTSNMPYDRMASELLTSSGSNFRVPQVNFYRAVQGRGPQPISAAVALTFMGSRIDKWPADRREGMEKLFSRVSFKPTAEWKEEIVSLDPAPMGSLETVLPDGKNIKVRPGADPRVEFSKWLLAPGNRWFARAAANRTWAWIFGRGIVHEPDDLRADNPPSVPGLLEYLENEFRTNHYDPKQLLRTILNSQVYQLSPVPQCTDPQAASMFASYPVRRLDAEVLQDALCRLTGTTEGYSSPIPEPFTNIPANAKSVNLSDGSITNTFLEMFGRSPRDSGRVMERNNQISDAQRLHLLNSSQVQTKIEKSWRLKNLLRENRENPAALVRAIWLEVLSRPPLPAEEQEALADEFAGSKQGIKEAMDDLVWALINSKEFLYRH